MDKKRCADRWMAEIVVDALEFFFCVKSKRPVFLVPEVYQEVIVELELLVSLSMRYVGLLYLDVKSVPEHIQYLEQGCFLVREKK